MSKQTIRVNRSRDPSDASYPVLHGPDLAHQTTGEESLKWKRKRRLDRATEHSDIDYTLASRLSDAQDRTDVVHDARRINAAFGRCIRNWRVWRYTEAAAIRDAASDLLDRSLFTGTRESSEIFVEGTASVFDWTSNNHERTDNMLETYFAGATPRLLVKHRGEPGADRSRFTVRPGPAVVRPVRPDALNNLSCLHLALIRSLAPARRFWGSC